MCDGKKSNPHKACTNTSLLPAPFLNLVYFFLVLDDSHSNYGV
jgi:hypothetical protein